MYISEAIKILDDYLNRFGDCKLSKVTTVDTCNVTDFNFIGGNEVIVRFEGDDEEIFFYSIFQEIWNRHRKKEWLEDCEGKN